MHEDPERTSVALIEPMAPRTLFAELVEGALTERRVAPSPLASAYLIELLDSRVRARTAAELADTEEATLAESLLRARLQRGTARLRRLRSLGDRALFIAGFFGDSLNRCIVDIDYYGDVGRAAYGSLAAALEQQVRERTWPDLYAELAERFDQFVDVLAEVGDRTRAGGADDLLRLYERYLRTGSERDRARLLRLGHTLPERRGVRFDQ